ncbi:GPCR, rhodopsin-like, 7TM,G protein-coupled receptor, rhodopsin-like [Cinara cedri]|uniref:GPCR, rhodopsin-like, 7TM,G protein-coupled receptor, rhodopsin-like n=1 Tax=Cinara cedri TaxID=506608 RepID=A0A5E4MVA7_9HEMI|nr:GPCR, rhodopsin-like, 7TM,G protein-coupled receptor, rhodopsin-like [Cinara cedri]
MAAVHVIVPRLFSFCILHRYYAIAAPLHYGTLVNSRKIMLGLCGIWIVCLLISMPPALRMVPYTYQPGLPVCTTDFSKGRATIFYSIFYTTVTLVLPGVIILGCNIKVFTIARYHRHRIASAIFEVTLSAQVTITHQRNPFFLPTAMANKLRRNNAFSAVFQILGSLAAFYLPYYGISLYESLCAAIGKQPRTYAAIKTLAFALITGSALCNGLLYGIKNKLLKKTYQNYRRKMMTKCEVNQEIQARTPSACGSRRPSLTPVAAAATGGAGCGGCKIGPTAVALLRRRSSDMSLMMEPLDIRRQYSGEGDDADYGGVGNYHNNGPMIRRSYSTNTTAAGGGDAAATERLIAANRNAFVRRILQDSRPGRSPRILITRAMSEENESYAFEPGTPVRKDLLAQKLSSSSVTLFIDDRGSRSGTGAGTPCLDDEDDTSLPAYSSLSSSNDDGGSCCGSGPARVSSM